MSCAIPDPAQWPDDRVRRINEHWAESARVASRSRTAVSVFAILGLLCLVGVHIVGGLEPSPVWSWCEVPLCVLLAVFAFLAGYCFADVGWFKWTDHDREQTLRRIQAEVSAEAAAAEDELPFKEYWYQLVSRAN